MTDARAPGSQAEIAWAMPKVATVSDYPDDPQTSALDVAQAMTKKVSDLS
jgi:hypothetical protein